MITQERLTERLDELEEQLPPIASKTVSFGRATTRRTTSIASSVIGEVTDRLDTVVQSFQTAGRTVTGQAASAAERSKASVETGVSEVSGQATAQAGAAVDTAEREAVGLLDDARKSVDPVTRSVASLDDLTKAELYTRAQERDIDGRASMTKRELIAALRR